MAILSDFEIIGGIGGGSGSGPTTPISTTDNGIVRWDGTGGTAIQDSAVLIDDSNNVTFPANVTINGTTTTINSTTTSVTAGFTTSIADTVNDVALTVTQNDTTNNPIAATITNAGTGIGLFVDQDGNGRSISIDTESTTQATINVEADALTSGNALRLYSGSASLTGALVDVAATNAGASGRMFSITNAGTGTGVFVDQNGTTTGNSAAIEINNDGNPGHGLFILSQQTAAANQELVKIVANNGAFDQDMVFLEYAGAVNALNITNSGSGNAISVNTSEFVIDSSGNVGIGTSSPGSLLQVGSATTFGTQDSTGVVTDNDATTWAEGTVSTWGTTLTVENISDTANTASTLRFNHRSSSAGIAAISSISSAADRADLRFMTRGSGGITEKMRIDNDGNVGIGATPSSSYQLEVNGGSGSGRPCFKGVTGSAETSIADATLKASNSAMWLTNNNGTAGNYTSLFFGGQNDPDSAIVGVHSTHTAASEVGDLVFLTSTGGSLSERMRINGAGLTTIPGDVNIDSGTFFVDASANSVGFGTTSPNSAYQAHFNGSAIGRIVISRIDTGSSFVDGSSLTQLAFAGQDSDSGFDDNAAIISAAATETWTGSAHGTRIDFNITNNGSTSSSKQFTIDQDGGIFCYNLLAAAASTDVNINGSDELHSVTSSLRYKENVVDSGISTDNFSKIRVVEYDFKEEHGGVHENGIIAEELEELYPEFVYKKAFIESEEEVDEEGNVTKEAVYGDPIPDSVQYSRLCLLLIKKVQELDEKINQLTA